MTKTYKQELNRLIEKIAILRIKKGISQKELSLKIGKNPEYGFKSHSESVKQTLEVLRNEEAKVVVVSSGVGNITESDILLAEASSAKIIGFNVKTEDKAENLAKQDKVDIENYSVIYECIEDVEKALKTLMAPKFADTKIGTVEVRQLFKVSSLGTIAGCYVLPSSILLVQPSFARRT